MTDRVFEYWQQPPIPLWKWILLHFVKTYKTMDSGPDNTVVLYGKMLFKVLYIWKVKTYDRFSGKLIKVEKLTRKD